MPFSILFENKHAEPRLQCMCKKIARIPYWSARIAPDFIAELKYLIPHITDNSGINILLILCYPAKRYLQPISQETKTCVSPLL